MPSVIRRARASRAPRKMPGKARALFTIFPSMANAAPAARASSGRISALGLERARMTWPCRIMPGLIRPGAPVVATTMSAWAITPCRVSRCPPACSSRAIASSLRSVPIRCLIPYESRSLEIPMPAAPRPTIPRVCSASVSPVSAQARSTEARTTTPVPCWSSCMTGMSSASWMRASISKQSGAATSSRLMAPKDEAIRTTAFTNSLGSRVSTSTGTPLIPASRSRRSAFPSITGIPATGPMAPRPRMAVPFVTIATVFPMPV